MKNSTRIFVMTKYVFFSYFLITTSINSLVAQQDNSGATKVLNIGSNLELFVDDYIIEKLTGDAHLILQHPVPKEIAINYDEPWEGTGCGYQSIFKDGDLYRMYYKAYSLNVTPFEKNNKSHRGYCCYAESNDGIHWRKPNLGLFDFEGSKANNIVIAPGKYKGINSDVEITDNTAVHPTVFKDENPDVAPDALYKGLFPSFTAGSRGLLPFKSPDGIHWSVMTDTPVITDGAFDSQNLAFWDKVHGIYRAYWRVGYEGVRAIATATSKDFVHWTERTDLKYVDSPVEHLYTNQIEPYYRAPDIYIGFPTRYNNRGWSATMQALPELEHRQYRSIGSERHGTAITEGLFMASHDGVTFKRWNEAFLRPGIEREGTWNYGQQYQAWGFLETKSDLEGAPNELSIYALESYWTGSGSMLRRYTLRIDGFVSVNAPARGGELVTKTLTFEGNRLVLNFSSSAAGSVQIEIQDENGNPVQGYSLNDCHPIFGDTIERMVIWNKGSDLSELQGKPVKLRFFLKDADVYSFKFKSNEQ